MVQNRAILTMADQ